MPQLNGITKEKSAVIKAVVLYMLLNAKLNDTDQKMLWSEVVHTYEGIQKSISTTFITEIPFEYFHEEKPNIIDLFSAFVLIKYFIKRDNINNQMTYKTYKSIMIGYADNHTRDTYKLYNTEIKRVVITRGVK